VWLGEEQVYRMKEREGRREDVQNEREDGRAGVQNDGEGGTERRCTE
jgi:hypothetical protein